jgi:hypothetical protein
MPAREGAMSHAEQTAAIQGLEVGDPVSAEISSTNNSLWTRIDGIVTTVIRNVANPALIATVRLKFTDFIASLSGVASPRAAAEGAAAVIQVPGRNTFVRRFAKLQTSDVDVDGVVEAAQRASVHRHELHSADQAAVATADSRAAAAQSAAAAAQAKVVEQDAIIAQQHRDLVQASQEVSQARASSVANAHNLEIGLNQYNDVCHARDVALAQVGELQSQLNQLILARQQSPDPAVPVGYVQPLPLAPAALAAAAPPLPVGPISIDITEPGTWGAALNPTKVNDLVTRLQLEFGVTTSSSTRLQDAFRLLRDQITALSYGTSAHDQNALDLLRLARNNVRDMHARDKFGDAAVARARDELHKQEFKRNPDSDPAFIALCQSHSRPRFSTLRCTRCNMFGHTATNCRTNLPSQGGAQGGPRRSH